MGTELKFGQSLVPIIPPSHSPAHITLNQQAAHSLQQEWRDELVEFHAMLQHKGRPRGSEGQEEGPQPSEPFQGGFQKKEGHTRS